MTPGMSRLMGEEAPKKPAGYRLAHHLAGAEEALEELVDSGDRWAEEPLEAVRRIITRATVRTRCERVWGAKSS